MKYEVRDFTSDIFLRKISKLVKIIENSYHADYFPFTQ